MSAYINKPFDLDSLVELVRSTSAGCARRNSKTLGDGSVLFATDQPIVLEVLNGRTSGVFESRIHGRDERTLIVLAPTRDNAVVEVAIRTPVRVGLAANDAYYSFNSYVLGLRMDDIPVVMIDKPNVIYRTQRRQSPRFAAEVDVRYGRVPAEDARPEALALARSCDISGGGIRILALEQLNPGDLVYLEAEAAGLIGPITAVGEVLRSKRAETDSEYLIAMRFRQVDGNLGRLPG